MPDLELTQVLDTHLRNLMGGRPPVCLHQPIVMPQVHEIGDAFEALDSAWREANDEMLKLLAERGLRPEDGAYDVTLFVRLQDSDDMKYVSQLVWMESRDGEAQ